MFSQARFSLPALPYAKDALEPHYSEELFDYHHGKHHKTYVEKLNKLIKDTEFEEMPLEEIIKGSYDKNHDIFNNAAQHYNHSFFWKCMKADGGGEPTGDLATAIKNTFGDFATFRKQFKHTAETHFGSGWAFLTLDKNSKLKIESCHDAACPIVHGSFPLMALDVWEHSYYLLYKNDRAGYVDAFLDHLVNWDFASQRYADAPKAHL
jgi:Fe-Mn family superoxide dismutase